MFIVNCTTVCMHGHILIKNPRSIKSPLLYISPLHHSHDIIPSPFPLLHITNDRKLSWGLEMRLCLLCKQREPTPLIGKIV